MGHINNAIAVRLGGIRKHVLSWVAFGKNYKIYFQNDLLIIIIIKNALNNYGNPDFSREFFRNNKSEPRIKNPFVNKSFTFSHTKIAQGLFFQHKNHKVKVFTPLIDLKNNSLMHGFRIIVAGRLTRKERAAFFVRKSGKVTLSAMSANIQYSSQAQSMRFGMVGVKVWLMTHVSKYRPYFYNFIFRDNLILIKALINQEIYNGLNFYKTNIRKKTINMTKRHMHRGRYGLHLSFVSNYPRAKFSRFLSTLNPRIKIHHCLEIYTPGKNNISTSPSGLTVPTPKGVTKPFRLHPKVVIDDKSYFICVSHKLPQLSKFPEKTIILYYERLSDDPDGKPQFLIATNQDVSYEFITRGDPKKLTTHFFGVHNPEREYNESRCFSAIDAIIQFHTTGELHPSVILYHVALNKPATHLSALGKTDQKKSLYQHLIEQIQGKTGTPTDKNDEDTTIS